MYVLTVYKTKFNTVKNHKVSNMPSPCSVVSWIKARHVVSKTDSSLLSSNHIDILNCLGGIKNCLMLLLKSRESFNTLQLIQLNCILTNINHNDKIGKNNTNSDMETDSNEKSMGLLDIGSECLCHITSFLSLTEISESFKNVSCLFAMIGLEEIKKVDCYYINGHDLIIENENELYDKYYHINVIDFGRKYFLRHSRIYCDTTAKEMFLKWSEKVNISLNHLSVWSYTERRNKTLRPNRKTKLNFKEKEDKRKQNEGVTEEMRVTHTVKIQPNTKKIRSIYDRIGGVYAHKVKIVYQCLIHKLK